jgi:hypothetical protein
MVHSEVNGVAEFSVILDAVNFISTTINITPKNQNGFHYLYEL